MPGLALAAKPWGESSGKPVFKIPGYFYAGMFYCSRFRLTPNILLPDLLLFCKRPPAGAAQTINVMQGHRIVHMSNEEHYRRLENLYAAAPINAFYNPRIQVRAGESEIVMNVSEKYFHAARAMHGSVYFKMLDDAAFFAANSLETEVLVLTTVFTTYLTRPVSTGIIKAIGRVVNTNRSQFIAEAVLYGSTGGEIGRGSGIFVRSRLRLGDAIGYRAQPGQGEQPA